jgi:single stranded DNA-binding protein
MNNVYLDGNIGTDPSLRFTQGGAAVMNFSMATTESIKRGNEWVEHTEWHSVVVWGNRAEALSKMLKNGSKVTIRGYIRSSEWTDKDNVVRKKFEIHASDVIAQNGLIPREGQSTQHRATHANDYVQPARQANNAPRQTTQAAPPALPANDGYGDDDDSIPF